jgi:hypothetical protein
MANVFLVRNEQTGETKRVNAEQIGTGDEWQAQCPFHRSEGLTLKLNTQKAVWQCMSCNTRGRVIVEDRIQSDSS